MRTIRAFSAACVLALLTLLFAPMATAQDQVQPNPTASASPTVTPGSPEEEASKEPVAITWDALPKKSDVFLDAYPIEPTYRNPIPVWVSSALLLLGAAAIFWGHGTRRRIKPTKS